MASVDVNFNNRDWFLDDILTLHKSKKEIVLCNVRISKTGLSLTSQTTKVYLPEEQNSSLESQQPCQSSVEYKKEDIIGYSTKISQTSPSPSVFLCIFAYPIVTSKKQARRKRQIIKLEFKKHNRFEQNLNSLKIWEAAVQQVLGMVGLINSPKCRSSIV